MLQLGTNILFNRIESDVFDRKSIWSIKTTKLMEMEQVITVACEACE